jgi:hypothetical protein
MAVYTVTHDSPVRYHIQGADNDHAIEIDDDLVNQYKTEKVVAQLFLDTKNVFELEVGFTNVFQKHASYQTQVLSATVAKFDPVHHKITCEFVPQESEILYFALNHQARYSRVTLFLRTVDQKRIPLETVTTYIDMSADPDYNVSSLTLHFRAQVKEIDAVMKSALEGKASCLNGSSQNQPPRSARRKLTFDEGLNIPNDIGPMPKLFASPNEPQICEPYCINNQLKWGAICHIQKAKFELTTTPAND